MAFDHLGCFTYSKEEGTKAARMEGQILESTKQQRQHKLMEVQRKLSEQKLSSYVGKTLSVLVKGVCEDSCYYYGRASTQAPEVDGLVYIQKDSKLKVGEIQNILIEKNDHYDLYGSVI